MPVARAFAELLEHVYPQEYQRRRVEIAAESKSETDSRTQDIQSMGVFVLDGTLPMQVVLCVWLPLKCKNKTD